MKNKDHLIIEADEDIEAPNSGITLLEVVAIHAMMNPNSGNTENELEPEFDWSGKFEDL